MTRYTVYREYVSGRDGDKGFDDLRLAELEFDDTSGDRNIVRVELIDNSDEANPVVLAAREPK